MYTTCITQTKQNTTHSTEWYILAHHNKAQHTAIKLILTFSSKAVANWPWGQNSDVPQDPQGPCLSGSISWLHHRADTWAKANELKCFNLLVALIN